MTEKYLSPEIEIIIVENDEIIATSPSGGSSLDTGSWIKPNRLRGGVDNE